MKGKLFVEDKKHLAQTDVNKEPGMYQVNIFQVYLASENSQDTHTHHCLLLFV